MKKLMILLLAALLLTGCAGGEDAAPTTEPTEPAVKTVYVHGSITRTQGGTTSRTEYIYNEEDLLTDVIVSDGNGQELQRYLVTCDENGNPVRWDTSVGGAASSVTYTYDAQGHTLGTYAYTGEELMTSTEYTWSGDLRVSVTVKVAAQSFEQRTEYTYDDKGHLQRLDLYAGGELSSYSLYTTDGQGRPITGESFDPEGNATATVTYIYDGTTETRTVTDANGFLTQTQVMTYDGQGNLLSNTVSDNTGNVISSEVHTWKAIEVPAELPRAGV